MKKTKLILTILGVLGFLSVAAFGAAYYIQQQQNIDPDGSKAAVMCTTDFECNGGVCRNGYCTALTQCEGESSQCGVPGADPCCTGLECKPMTGSNTYSCQKITAPTACKRWFDGCNNRVELDNLRKKKQPPVSDNEIGGPNDYAHGM